jgi:hypothetical protein
MPNLRFNYFFRDGDNYKLFGSEVFSNEQKLQLSTIIDLINSSLIDGQYFYPSDWNLPLLTSEDGRGMEETDWCEFEGVEETEDDVSLGDVLGWVNMIGR